MIAIVGAGFAGLSCFQQLRSRGVPAAEIRVIEPATAFVYLPALHEALGRAERIADISLPYTDILEESWIQERATDISTENEITLSSGQTLQADTVVVAAGLDPLYADPSWQEHAIAFRSIAELEEINRRLPRADTVSVVGGSYTGVEIATILAETFASKSIQLIHSRDTLLHQLDERAGRQAHDICQELDIQPVLGERVDTIAADSLQLQSGRTLQSDLTILATGWDGHSLLPSETKQADNRYYIGDMSPERRLNTAHNAMVEGRCIAKQIAAQHGLGKSCVQPNYAQALAISLGRHHGMLTYGTRTLPLPYFTGLAKRMVEIYIVQQLKRGWILPL